LEDHARHIKVGRDEKKSEAKVGLVALVVLVALVAALWIVKARKHDPRDLEMMKAREAALAPKETVPELSVVSTAPLPAGRMDEVSRALNPSMIAAARCMQGIYGTVFVDVTFGADGKVREARFASKNTVPYAELLAGTCFLEKLREPSVSPGSGDVTAMFPVRNLPGQKVNEGAAKGTGVPIGGPSP